MLITNEDNMKLMSRYPDNYFDLAIVDPPYGIGEDGGDKQRNFKSKKCPKGTNKHYTKKIGIIQNLMQIILLN
jgi:site-specific DNA-methyltransferase (adenine-specific)